MCYDVTKKPWTDLLPADVSRRLSDCKNTKEDIAVLVNARWRWLQDREKDKEGFTKEDALIYIELLYSNNQWQLADLTREEYDELTR